MNLFFPQRVGNFLFNGVTVRFSRRTLLREVLMFYFRKKVCKTLGCEMKIKNHVQFSFVPFVHNYIIT